MCRLSKLSSIIAAAILLLLITTAKPVEAGWPPFEFELIPSYSEGRITYQLQFDSQVDWSMTNITVKILLPEGTRFVEAHAQPTTRVDFDGTEITFFTAVLYQPIKDASFVVEVTDPDKTIFATHAWIAWEGDQPGNYLTDGVAIDITRQPLNWTPPAPSRLELTLSAIVDDDLITYFIYPKNVGGRMWDLQVKAPVPEGTTFLSAETPPTFVSNFDGREVSFSTIELKRGAEVGPLSFKVSTAGVTTPLVTTHAWATWKNSGRRVGRTTQSQEEFRTGDIMVQPGVSQLVVSDLSGDVPLANYDLTSVALQEVALPAGELALKINFYTAQDLGLVGEPLVFSLYIDQDCQRNTGQHKGPFGADYQVLYKHYEGTAEISRWDEAAQHWPKIQRINSNNPVGTRTVTMWVPYRLLENGRQFCWLAEVKNRTVGFNLKLPTEQLPDMNRPKLGQYKAGATNIETEVETMVSSAAPDTSGTFFRVGDVWRYMPGWSEPPPGWQTLDFDDNDWFSGPTAIGYGTGRYATDLSLITHPIQADGAATLVERSANQAGMTLAVLASGDEGGLYMRRPFTVTNPSLISQLNLKIGYEGGFVAYLNGAEVARRGLGEPESPVFYDTLAAPASNKSKTSETIDLSDYLGNLVAGVNLLAIEGHRSSNDANLSIAPKLSWKFDPADLPASLTPPDDAANTSAPAPPAILPTLNDITGKLAVPVDNGRVAYDIHIFSMPTGQELVKILNARQPNFRFDGQRLLINREGGGIENVYEYNFADGTEKQVSDAPQDWYPFYDPWGNRVVYGNSELTVGSQEWIINEHGERVLASIRKPFIFVQCGLLPPHQEQEARCRDIPSLGVLVPAGQVGEIQGTHPVWTANDMIAYKGCNTWAGSGLCGIYLVPASSTKGFSDGFIPRQLTHDTSDIPSDTKANLIAFTSHRDGNWEAYIMDLNGAGVKNLSNSPTSNDGLPTISPDGNWVAFVSDRAGHWAVWVTLLADGSAQKLFDLPADVPWGDSGRAWTNERISWAP